MSQNQIIMNESNNSEAAVAGRLRELRLALGFTNQSEFARQSDIPIGDWNHFEKNRRQLPLSAARKLRLRWGVTLDWLYEGDDGCLPWTVKEKLLDLKRLDAAG